MDEFLLGKSKDKGKGLCLKLQILNIKNDPATSERSRVFLSLYLRC